MIWNRARLGQSAVSASLFLVLISFHTAYAAFGDPDPSFGYGGNRIDLALDFIPQRTIIQNDGKILVTGYRYESGQPTILVLRRYNSNGTVDTSFGSSGTAIPYNIYGEAEDLLVLASGKIVVVGYTWPPSEYITATVWRFNTNGWYDSTFGSNGRVVLENAFVSGIAKVSQRVGSEHLIVGLDDKLIRLQSNGTYYSLFGSGGAALVPFTAEGIAVKNAGVYVVGRQGNESVVAKYTLSGQPDINFGSQGISIASNLATYGCLPPSDQNFLAEGYERLAFQSDGKVIAGGWVQTYKPLGEALPISYRTLLNRHDLNGGFDIGFTSPCDNILSFFSSGDAYTDWTSARSIVVEQTDEILVSAWSEREVIRFSQSGAAVDSFEVSGGSNFADKVLDVAVQSDGKIVVSALRVIGGKYYNQLSRHLP